MSLQWLDDLTTRVDQIKERLPEGIQTYLGSRLTEEFVKVTGGEKGNQTALDIANGKFGQGVPLANAGGNPASNNAISASQILSGGIMGMSPIFLIGVAAGAWYLLKKKR